MSALILLPAAGCVIAATAGVLIRTRRERADKRMREEFKNVFRLQEQLNCRKSADE
jgi:hypothetical protein